VSEAELILQQLQNFLQDKLPKSILQKGYNKMQLQAKKGVLLQKMHENFLPPSKKED
jgi:hypothetical protein